MDIKMLFGKTAYTKGNINEYTSDIESEPPVFEYNYSFPLDGEVYVDYSFNNRYIDSSSQVNIEYLVSDPNVSRIEGTTNTPTGLTYIYLFVGLSIFQGFLLIRSLKKDTRKGSSK